MPTARRITARPITARRIVGRPIGVRGIPDRDMILVFDTTLATGTEVIVPLAGTVDCTVDWGDGTSDSYTTKGNKTHTYTEEGEYTVRISGTLTGFGANVARPNLTKCLSFGEIGLESLLRGFRTCANFVQVPKSLPKESTVTNLGQLMLGATSFNDPNITLWDVSGVTELSNFARNSDAFDQDLGAWPLRVAGVDMRNALTTNTTAQGMSVENYSRTLIGWANYIAANGGPLNVRLRAGKRQYNNTAYVSGETYNDAVAARAYLTTATANGGAG